MYRKDIFEEKNLTMPAHPTWQQVADLAAEADGAQPGMKGICLRGLPGWGELIAPLTTVVNTMGGTWFTKDWKAQLTSPEFDKATKFYVDLVRDHGEAGAPQSGYAECLNNMTQGKTAMWYDATAGAGSLEAKGSPVKGKIGYVPAPVDKTESSGWLYTWAWGMQKASKNSGQRLEVHLLGVQQGVRAPGRREDRLVQRARRQARLDLRQPRLPQGRRRVRRRHQGSASPARTRRDPGAQPRPTVGIQFVDIPEFTDLGTKVSQEISAAIAGKTVSQRGSEDLPGTRREGRRGAEVSTSVSTPSLSPAGPSRPRGAARRSPSPAGPAPGPPAPRCCPLWSS